MTETRSSSEPGTDKVTWSDNIATYFSEREPDGDGDIVVIMPAEMRDGFVTMMNEHDALQARVEELTKALQAIVDVIGLEWQFAGAHPHRQALIEHAQKALATPLEDRK
jgi:hypothetical protein